MRTGAGVADLQQIEEGGNVDVLAVVAGVRLGQVEDQIRRAARETEQAFLVRINTVLVLALGVDGQHGTLVTVCQTIIVQITQIIVVVTQGPERDYDVKMAS